jgi:hypothetical protein
MSYGTIVQSGSFTATGAARTLTLRSDVDFIEVFNWTASIPANNTGNKFAWFRGMATNDAMVQYWNGASTALLSNTAVNLGVGGFTLIDSSNQTPAGAIVVTAGTNATQPVFNSAGTNLSNGDIVRIQNSDFVNLNGLDFTIDTVNAGVSFRLANALATAPGAALAVNFGTYRKITYDPIYYPRNRMLANITQAAAGVVTTLVNHGFTTGQKVRFYIPDVNGMTDLDGLTATVTYLTASTFSIDINTTGFTAFRYPTIALNDGYYGQVTPIGEDSAIAPNVLDDATRNTAYIGMQLAAGITSPAGQVNDVIYWVAYKSENL